MSSYNCYPAEKSARATSLDVKTNYLENWLNLWENYLATQGHLNKSEKEDMIRCAKDIVAKLSRIPIQNKIYAQAMKQLWLN